MVRAWNDSSRSGTSRDSAAIVRLLKRSNQKHGHGRQQEVRASYRRLDCAEKAFYLLNLWLAFHLFAIIICPCIRRTLFGHRRAGFRLISPYSYFLYLDHGFHYFVPDPGASTLVDYSQNCPTDQSRPAASQVAPLFLGCFTIATSCCPNSWERPRRTHSACRASAGSPNL